MAKKTTAFKQDQETTPERSTVVNFPSQQSSRISHNRFLIAGVIIVMLALGTAGYFFVQYQKTQSMLLNPNKAAQLATQSLVEKVGKLIMLPHDEFPQVATVSDVKKLASQQFFKNAVNGDKVLIYTKSKKAILYRPSTNVLVEVSTINIAPSTASEKGNVAGVATSKLISTPSPTVVKLVIYNGTATVGLAKIAEKQINDQKLPNLQIVDTANANRKDYTKTLVIDLKGSNSDSVKNLASFLGGEVSSLPQGEITPNADILVIVGQ